MGLPESDAQNSTPDTEEVNDSPIEQVRLTVPTTDDPTLPCLTFRTWFLGIISCCVLAFMNQFFGYRQNALYDSFKAQQIGSGLKGYGIGAFGLDWATVASFLGSPLATPGFAMVIPNVCFQDIQC
nr:oligopeptide transporter 1 [Tanacetum cinerariifolium]